MAVTVEITQIDQPMTQIVARVLVERRRAEKLLIWDRIERITVEHEKLPRPILIGHPNDANDQLISSIVVEINSEAGTVPVLNVVSDYCPLGVSIPS